jgi:hypothetical protein
MLLPSVTACAAVPVCSSGRCSCCKPVFRCLLNKLHADSARAGAPVLAQVSWLSHLLSCPVPLALTFCHLQFVSALCVATLAGRCVSLRCMFLGSSLAELRVVPLAPTFCHLLYLRCALQPLLCRSSAAELLSAIGTQFLPPVYICAGASV